MLAAFIAYDVLLLHGTSGRIRSKPYAAREIPQNSALQHYARRNLELSCETGGDTGS